MMSPKQRWLAALDLEPVDRLPFWPKLDGAYARAQRPPFDALSLPELHAWLGSDPWEWTGSGLREARATTGCEVVRTGDTQRTIFRTPHGERELVCRFDPASQSWHPVAFPVRTRADLTAMAAWYDDLRCEVDPAAAAQARERYEGYGDRAMVAAGLGTTPLMHFLEWEAGIDGGQYLLHDAPDEVEALFAAAQRALLRRAEIVLATSPADLFFLVENTSTTLLSPAQYRRWGLAQVGAVAALAVAHGKRLALHMCGHLRALLPDLATLPAAAYEAFTSPTLGNTTLLDGRTQCPRVCLIGGTNATLWLQPAERIIAGLAAALAPLPHHRGLVLTSAGVMPPACPPETIRAVGDWVRAYPARMG
jgi:hypothetical protein